MPPLPGIPPAPGRADPVRLAKLARLLESGTTEVEAYEQVFGPIDVVTQMERTFIARAAVTHPYVMMERQRLRSEGCAELDISARRVLEELAAIAFVDPRKLVDRVRSLTDGPDADPDRLVWRALDEIPADVAHAIASIEPAMGGGYKVKFHNKLDALAKLAEYTQALVPRREATTVRAEELTDEELSLVLLELDGVQGTGAEPEVLGPEGEVEP